jgi:hypothetical protein
MKRLVRILYLTTPKKIHSNFFFVIAALAALKAYPGGMQESLFSKVSYTQ